MPSGAGPPALTPTQQPESLSDIMSTYPLILISTLLCHSGQCAFHLPSSHHLHSSLPCRSQAMIFRIQPTNVSRIRSLRPRRETVWKRGETRMADSIVGRVSPPRRWSKMMPVQPVSARPPKPILPYHAVPKLGTDSLQLPSSVTFLGSAGHPNYRRSWRRSTVSGLRLSPRSIATMLFLDAGPRWTTHSLCLRLSCPSLLGEHVAALGSAFALLT